MEKQIHFTKMSGAGNDFVVIDNMDGAIQGDHAAIARALCSRHFGIGADGLLLLEQSTLADFRMMYYNADGSFGGMCGNGGRCVARFAFSNSISGEHVRFEALGYTYSAQVTGNSVRLWMKRPDSFRMNMNISVSTPAQDYEGHFVNTGSPHFVCEVDDIEHLDIEKVGRQIRSHEFFAPDGCNVNFVKLLGKDQLAIRTYERGVEAETLACGTGSVASAIVMALLYNMPSPVALNVKSGETLSVCFDRDGREFSNVALEGSAHCLYVGTLTFDTATHKLRDIGSISQ